MSAADSLRRDLAAALDGEVRFDVVSRALYSSDASVYQIEPLGVVIPRSVEDVVRAVEIAGRHGVAITPRGGGTSQAGQAVGAGLVIDTSKHLNRVLHVDPDARTARVQPGVVLDDLNAARQPHGLRFAPDVSSASRATVGGLIANNSSGARSVIYGKTIDHVRELHVVLADGSIAHVRPLDADALAAASSGDSLLARAYRTIPALARRHAAEIDRRFPKILRRVGGYNLDAFVDPGRPVDLSRLIVGSEGTLGFVVEATLGLVPLPKAKALLTAEFDQLLDALGATPLILRHGPAAVEVMDDFILSHTRETRRSRPCAGPSSSTTARPCSASSSTPMTPPTCRRGSRRWRRTWRPAASPAARALTDPAAQARLAPRGGPRAVDGDHGRRQGRVVRRGHRRRADRLRDYIARFGGSSPSRHDRRRLRARVGRLPARASGGRHEDRRGRGRFEAIATEVADLVLEFGGALSGEHGDGLVRGAFNEKMFGPELCGPSASSSAPSTPTAASTPAASWTRRPSPPTCASAPATNARSATVFDYTAFGGFAAPSRCAAASRCRKTRGGTMCPSFMVTREEMHSTRGGPTSSAWLNGRLREAGLDDHGVKAALDLCLECRACKSECPVNVDVGRYKSEFLAGYWQRHGTSAAARVFGRVHEAAPWASTLAPVANRLAATAIGRRLAAAVADVDPRRTLPAWAGRPLRARLAGHVSRAASPRAVLFADTFTSYMEPDIGVAAVEEIERAGPGATLAPHACCGRPLISQGLLDEARELAAKNVTTLYPRAAGGQAIVFVEPSCLSAVREDAPDLLRGSLREKAMVVARQAVLFEDYLERELSAGLVSLPLAPGPPDILLHVHCHQRSMGLGRAAQALLSRIPGARVTDLDAGCCGMAGSFGYTRAHYDVSAAIGERRLFPAARTLPAGGVLAAAGTSCRHQVAHFTGVTATHPAVLLHSLLETARP